METWGAIDNRYKDSFHEYLQKYYTVLQDLYCKPIAHKCHIFSLIYSISSKHLFTDVSDFGALKKLKLHTSGLIFPPHQGKGQVPTPKKTY